MAKEKAKKILSFKNKKAWHDYNILDTYEAGISLLGSEVKAIRDGRLNIKDSHVRIIKNEAYLMNMHITHLSTAHVSYRPDERRERKLLLHRKEINKIFEKVMKEGVTIVPLKLYFNKNNMVKLQIATATGKKLYDKRNDLKEKTLKRDTQQALKNY